MWIYVGYAAENEVCSERDIFCFYWSEFPCRNMTYGQYAEQQRQHRFGYLLNVCISFVVHTNSATLALSGAANSFAILFPEISKDKWFTFNDEHFITLRNNIFVLSYFFRRTCDSSESWVFALNIYYMSRCIPFDIHMNENMQLSWEKSCSLFICVSWHLVLLSVIRAMVC